MTYHTAERPGAPPPFSVSERVIGHNFAQPTGRVRWRAEMVKTQSTADCVVRGAAWFYLAPRVIILACIVVAFGLAAFLVLTPLLRAWLIGMGA